MNNTLNLAIRKVARKLSVDSELVESVYKSYWLFIKEHASSLPLREMGQEEFDSTVSNFNIPFIGKLYVDYNSIEKYKRQIKYNKDAKAKKSEACGLSSVSD